MQGRQVPLIVIASMSASLADSVAVQLRREGNVVYVTHSADGCLRVATSVGPDVILLDPRLPDPRRLERLLKAHPISAGARILHLSEVARAKFTLPRSPAATAGPHAA
jgi:DNA-binding response OmpR family regulator